MNFARGHRMHALVKVAHAVEARDMPRPVIRGPLDVLVRVRSASVCTSDLAIFVALFRVRRTVDVDKIALLKW